MSGGIGAAVLLLVLFLLVVLAVASFFRHMLAASLVLLAIPVVVLLHARVGTLYSAFAIAAVAIFVALIQTVTGSLNDERELQTQTLLPNGKVLAAGGWPEGTSTGTAELYDPATETWTFTGDAAVEPIPHRGLIGTPVT